MCNDHSTSIFQNRRAFTLVELLIVIAVLAILSGGAYVVVSNVRESARVTKLESDAETLNRAIIAYESNGGSLDGVTGVDDVLARLKKVSSHRMPGMSGRAVDPRLEATVQTAAEAAGNSERAIYRSKRFEIVTTSDGPGVKEFTLNDAIGAAAPTPENRKSAIRVAEDNSWIWDSQAATPIPRVSGPTPPGTIAGTRTPPTAPGTMPLELPVIKPTDSEQPLASFELPVTFDNPNYPGVSEIWFSAAGSPMQRYTGQTITVEPGQAVVAQARTIDPDHWSDSEQTPPKEYTATPLELHASVSSPVDKLTYQAAGGALEGVAASAAPSATISVEAVDNIRPKYLSSANFEIVWTYDGSNPLTSPSAHAATGSFSGVWPSQDVSLDIANWPANSPLTIKAAVRAKNTDLFRNTEEENFATASVAIDPTLMGVPIVDPASGNKAVDYPVTMDFSSAQPVPAGAQIYYTTDGTVPGNNNGVHVGGTLYSGAFNSGAGEDGVVVVIARAYGPPAYAAWFTPSDAAANTYTSITLADGALVGSAQLNGTFVGSLIYASPSSGGTMSPIQFTQGAKILNGNLYLPGTPKIYSDWVGEPREWNPQRDSLFTSHILGWEFDSAGSKTVRTTPLVLNENGSQQPDNYYVVMYNDSLVEGKVIRRHNAPAFPTIAPPPPPDSTGPPLSLNNPWPTPVSASQYANVTINTSSVGDVRLLAGHYGDLTANNNSAFVLGDPDNPNVTQVYSFKSLRLNSSADLKIVGKVIITVGGSIETNNGSILGDPNHPEWLQIQLSSGGIQVTSGSSVYAQIVAPSGTVNFHNGSVFQGSVTANSLVITSSSVVFNLPPVIQN